MAEVAEAEDRAEAVETSGEASAMGCVAGAEEDLEATEADPSQQTYLRSSCPRH